MVELQTVNRLRFVTDNTGRAAFLEPGLMGREVYFHVRSHGYDVPKDGFGYAGVRLTPKPGERAEIRLTRRNLAERLYRVTGEGLYRDSLLLGHRVPVAHPLGAGLVAGQDSVQAAVYAGKLHWFWGDTDRMSYPLGHFRTSGATSPLPSRARLQTQAGLDLDYFTDAAGFSRPMFPLPERPEGVIWIDGLAVVPDAAGRERMLCHYSRRKGLADQLEHGLAQFDDRQARFLPASTLDARETWRHPHGHATIVEEQGARWVYCGLPLLHVRVPARVEAMLDPARYEAFTCLAAGDDPETAPPRRTAEGRLDWAWRADAPPAGPRQEARWLKAGAIRPNETRFLPVDPASGERPVLHGGTVRWNEFRKRWIAIGVQIGGAASNLGEVWYAEASSPVGPFARAVKIASHDRQDFYNPAHHDFLDEYGGRLIFFEGTYVNTFSGNPDATPRYNYNQIMYRLDLSDPRVNTGPGSARR
jgi:hypothetical protein